MIATPASVLRFGSFHGRVTVGRPEHADALANVFGAGLQPAGVLDDTAPQFAMVIEDAPCLDAAAALGVPENTLVLGGTRDRPTIATDAIRAELWLDSEPAQVWITVPGGDMPFPALCVHFGVIIHKVLFHFDRLMLHAAAVRVGDEVSLFVGDKGAGKSTTSLALARAGGAVLGEDQVVLWRRDSEYLVSGSDERSRVTERTERHFFPEPLPVAPRDFAGTMKKEIAMRDYFRSDPFRDHPPSRLIFPRVTGRFELKPLKPQAALRRMMAYNGHFQRFEGARDQAAFLDFLAGFIASVSCWELSLSHDLAQLDVLADTLKSA